jgi:hypothetical protein
MAQWIQDPAHTVFYTTDKGPPQIGNLVFLMKQKWVRLATPITALEECVVIQEYYGMEKR